MHINKIYKSVERGRPMENVCKNCKYGIDYGDSVDYIYCEKNKIKKSVKKLDTCKDFNKENVTLVVKGLEGGDEK